MFSKVLVNFTGIFLILYISATSATPTAQPGEAHEIIDNIHARSYNRYQCVTPYAWLRRECVGTLGPRAWHDVCAHSTYADLTQLSYDNKPGTCPVGTACLDTLNEGRRFINCVPVGQRQTIVGNKRKRDSQIGTSDPKRAYPDLKNTQFEYSVTIDHDMTQAAVAAVVTSEDYDFLIAPNNIIVGNPLHGRKQVVCKGDKSSRTKARECYPNGTYNFKKGDIIDYTWGMTNDQEGTLLYGIMPS